MRKNNSLKSICIMSVILLLLAGVYFFMTTGDSPRKTAKVFSFGKNESIVSYQVKNNYGEFALEKEEGAWQIIKPQSYIADQNKIETSISLLTNLPVARILEEETEEYGFQNPSITIEIITDKNQKRVLYIGNKSPSQSQYYVKEEGKKEVYIVDAGYIAPFEGSLSSFRNKELISVDMNQLVSLSYSKEGAKQITIEKQQNGDWQLTFPYKASARKTEIDEFILKLRGLSAVKFPDANLSLEAMGIESDSESITLLDSEGNEQTMVFGLETNGQRYVRTGGENDVAMVFSVDTDFSKLNDKALIYEAPLKNTIEEISSIKITSKETALKLQIDTEKEIYRIEGKEISRGDMASILLRYINLFAYSYEPFVGQINSEPDYVFETALKDGSKKTLKLYHRDDTTYYMDYGKGIEFYMEKERVERLEVWLNKAINPS